MIRLSAKPPRAAEIARAEKRMARAWHRDFDLARAIAAAEEAAAWLKRVLRQTKP